MKGQRIGIMQNIPKIFLSLCGVGFLPVMPGTFGSLVSLFFWMWWNGAYSHIVSSRIVFLLLIFVIFFLLSVFFIIQTTRSHQRDESWIVMDEFLGMLVTLAPLFFFDFIGWYWWFVGFGLFRFFDIVKPLGIMKIDQKGTVVSVILDDILAGVYSAIILWIVVFFFG